MRETQEWTDVLITGCRRVLAHTPLGAYPDPESARERKPSPYVRTLNGRWQFLLTESPSDVPGDVQSKLRAPCGAPGDWLDMPVPSNWQLDERVADQPIYTNVPYPFEGTPPMVPEVNPTGWYRRAFDVPSDWEGREIFLHFESCDSACKVWVNGEEVGYSEDSKLPHEFNVTVFVRPGANELAVMIPRYGTGFWLECQDYWHLSGIQRDVTLYSKPNEHIRDFVVRTSFGADYRDAELFVSVHMNERRGLVGGYVVSIQLYDGQGAAQYAKMPESPVSAGSLRLIARHCWGAM